MIAASTCMIVEYRAGMFEIQDLLVHPRYHRTPSSSILSSIAPPTDDDVEDVICDVIYLK